MRGHIRFGVNRTKVGLKRPLEISIGEPQSRVNRTKVGLKPVGFNYFKPMNPRVNRTKVGLKLRSSGFRLARYFKS